MYFKIHTFPPTFPQFHLGIGFSVLIGTVGAGIDAFIWWTLLIALGVWCLHFSK